MHTESEICENESHSLILIFILYGVGSYGLPPPGQLLPTSAVWRDVTACNDTCKRLARGLEVVKYGAGGGEVQRT